MILIPHVRGMLQTATADWARAHDARTVELDPDDDHAYARLLVWGWAQPGDLLVVEQDNVPPEPWPPACADEWCSAAYPTDTALATEALGCVRFASTLKDRHPNLLQQVARMDDISGGTPAHWRVLDVYIARTLRALGYRVCVHGTAQHLHRYR